MPSILYIFSNTNLYEQDNTLDLSILGHTHVYINRHIADADSANNKTAVGQLWRTQKELAVHDYSI